MSCVRELRGGAKMHEVTLEATRGWKAGERLNFWEFPKGFNFERYFDAIGRQAFIHVRRTRFGKQDENFVGESVRLMRDKESGTTYLWDAASVTHDDLVDILNSTGGKRLTASVYDKYTKDTVGWSNLYDWTDIPGSNRTEKYDVGSLNWIELTSFAA